MTKKFIGVYDVFSSMIVHRTHHDLFLSGFSYTASTYGLADIGFMTWQDVIETAARIKSRCKDVNLLVDIDDGFGGPDIAGYVAKELEKIGVWGIVLEDQARPKKCGHVDGKKVVSLDKYLEVLESVIKKSNNLRIIARTDSTDPDEQVHRLQAFCQYPIYAALVDGISTERYFELKKISTKMLCLNYIYGGRAIINNSSLDLIDHLIFSTSCISSVGHALVQTTNKIIDNSIFGVSKHLSLSEIREITENF